MKGSSSFEISSQSAIDHLLRHAPQKVQRLSFALTAEKLGPRHIELLSLAKKHSIQVDFGYRHPKATEGVLASLKAFEYAELKPTLNALKGKARSVILVLDHLQDVQNFGALARSAEALGADAIIIPKDRSAQVNEGAYNISVGAIETIPVVQVANIAETLKRLKDFEYWIVGSALNEKTKPLNETPTFERVAIVLGSELDGISPHVQESCDWLVAIPMKGKVQSLNVSAAGAVLLHFFVGR